MINPVDFQQKLLCWYRENRRKMPWREIENPYYTWISEIMLQQTRVDVVIPYFYRFIEAFPGIEELANSREEEVLKLWEGLGYYQRGKNLRLAAIQIVEHYGGEIPRKAEDLITLKGIGDYTSGAIASIAFGEKVAAVDGNVERVIARYLCDKKDLRSSGTKKRIKEKVNHFLPEEHLSEFNQGLIELGALICTPGKNPKCLECPLRESCCAYRKGDVDKIPYKSKKTKPKREKRTILIIQKGDFYYIKKRMKKGLLEGMWEFPNLEGHLNRKEIQQAVKDELSISEAPPSVEFIGRVEAIFSHRIWEMEGYFIKFPEDLTTVLKEESEQKKRAWATKDDLDKNYTIASAYKHFKKYIGRSEKDEVQL